MYPDATQGKQVLGDNSEESLLAYSGRYTKKQILERMAQRIQEYNLQKEQRKLEKKEKKRESRKNFDM